MSISVKMTSIEDEDKFIFLTYESGWKKTKFYSNGSLIFESNNQEELVEGITFNVPEDGIAEFKINATTFEPTLYVNNDLYLSEPSASSTRNSTVGAVAVFSFLAFLNLVPILLGADRLSNSKATEFDFVMIIFFAFYMIIYGLSAILLARKKYLFYFIGTGLFTFTTLLIVFAGLTDFDGGFLLLIAAPRFVIIGLLLIYLKRVLRLMKAAKSSTNVLDRNDV